MEKTALEIINETYNQLNEHQEEKCALDIVNDSYEKLAGLGALKTLGNGVMKSVTGNKVVSGAKDYMKHTKDINHVTGIKNRMKAKGNITPDTLRDMKSTIGTHKTGQSAAINQMKEGAGDAFKGMKTLGNKAIDFTRENPLAATSIGIAGTVGAKGIANQFDKKHQKTASEIVSECLNK